MAAVHSGVAAVAGDKISLNLNGQKLGRKGRDSRARIIAAASELVAQGGLGPVTLSAVARKSGLGLTSLYVYFNDLTEVLLAVLEPVRAAAEDAYLQLMRQRWPDESLGRHCRDFASAYYAFWQEHSRILHLCNSLADQNDQRMVQHRADAVMPVIQMLVEQMDGDLEQHGSPVYALAIMLVMAIERAATIRTDETLPDLLESGMMQDADRFIHPATRLLEMAIRDARAGG